METNNEKPELTLEELDLEIEELSIKLENASEEDFPKYKEELKALYKKQKLLKKKMRSGIENVRSWVWVYGVLQTIISSPLSILVWIQIFNSITKSFNDTLGKLGNNVSTTAYKAILSVVFFIAPALNVFLSWILYAFVVRKDVREERITYKIIWIVQASLTLISIIIALALIIIPTFKAI